MTARISVALRTVAAAALVVLASGAAVRTLAGAFDPFRPYPGHTSDYGVARPRAIREAIPAIVEHADTSVIVLGSSGLARAFVPSIFDAALDRNGRYVSFNLAQLLFQPETALSMAKVLRQSYEARGAHVGITIFGISVPELTRDALGAARRGMPDQAFVFSNAEVLEERASVDPVGALGDGLGLLVYGNVRPERVGLWFEDRIEQRRPPCESGLKQPPDGEGAQAVLDAYCTELAKQFPGGVPPWNPHTRGGFDYGLPATRPLLARLIDLRTSSGVANPPPPAPTQTVTFKAPDIDEDGVRTLIAAVRELKAISRATFVLRDLLNPALLAPLPEAQIAEWRAVAERIAREGGAPLLDLNDGTFGAADFGDKTHLHPLAAERFSIALASRVHPMVREDRASR